MDLKLEVGLKERYLYQRPGHMSGQRNARNQARRHSAPTQGQVKYQVVLCNMFSAIMLFTACSNVLLCPGLHACFVTVMPKSGIPQPRGDKVNAQPQSHLHTPKPQRSVRYSQATQLFLPQVRPENLRSHSRNHWSATLPRQSHKALKCGAKSVLFTILHLTIESTCYNHSVAYLITLRSTTCQGYISTHVSQKENLSCLEHHVALEHGCSAGSEMVASRRSD